MESFKAEDQVKGASIVQNLITALGHTSFWWVKHLLQIVSSRLLLVPDGAGGNMVTWGSGNWMRCVVSADVEMLAHRWLWVCRVPACLPTCMNDCIPGTWLGSRSENRNAFGCSAVRIALGAFTRSSCGRVQLFLFCSISSYRSTVPFDGLTLVVAVTVWWFLTVRLHFTIILRWFGVAHGRAWETPWLFQGMSLTRS
jgi:hypothetical protein